MMDFENVEIRSKKNILEFDKIVLFGAGGYILDSIKTFGEDRIQAIFDNDETKWGNIINGLEVLNPNKYIPDLIGENCAVVLSTSAFQYEIAAQLEELGIKRKQIFSLCPDYQENKMYDVYDILNNISKIEDAYTLFEDAESKKYFYESLVGRLTHDPFYFKGNQNMQGIYHYQGSGVDIKPHAYDHILDCGAYIGDSAQEFLRMTENTAKVSCFEPFRDNYLKLEEWKKTNDLEAVVNTYCLALSDLQGEMEISADTEISMKANLRDQSDIKQKVRVSTIDNIQNMLHERIDFIKMDIEGEELRALMGARATINKYHPQLMISAYHITNHLWEIPILIQNICPNYRIYLGHNPNVPFEPEVYAVYDENCTK